MIGKHASVSFCLIRACLIFFITSPVFPLFGEPVADSRNSTNPPTLLSDKITDSSSDLATIESSLIPTFIELQMSSNKGDHFYNVLIDNEERPYLDILDAVNNYLKTSGECNAEIYFCEVTINYTKRKYWIDGVQLKSSIFGNDSGTVQMPPNVLVRKEGKLWLRFDYWPQWLPVSTKWDLDTYHLDFFPEFPLADVLRQKRADMRRIALAATKEREQILNLPAKEATSDFDTHVRYHLEHTRHFGHVENTTQLDFALNLDLWKGTFLATGNYTQQEMEEETTTSDSSWRYSRYNNEYFYQYEMGSLNLAGSLLIPYTSLDNAIHIKRLKTKEGVERMRFQGLVQPGTEIDLYYKSFLIDTITADNSGQYSFKDILASGGEEVKLNYFYPDGSSKVETMLIASDDGSILRYHDWDSEVYYGSTETTNISMLSGYYGLFDNLTIGLHNTQYSLIEKDEEQNSTSTIAIFSLAWRLFYGMNMLAEHSSSGGDANNALQVNLSFFRPHSFSLLYRTLSEDGELWNQYSDSSKKKASYLEMQHLVGIRSWLWRAIYKNWDEGESLNLTIMYRINRNMAIFWNPYLQKKQDVESDEHTVGANYSSTYHTARFSTRLMEEGAEPSLSYRFSGKKKYPWNFSIGVSQSTEGVQTYHAQAEYRFTPQLSTEVRNENGDSSASVAWDGIWVSGQGPESWEDFATGTLYGKVLTQKDQDSAPVPVEGAIVMAQSKKAVTDENGSYLITGLPAYDRIKVSVDRGSLDIDLAPEKELEVVVFRPGTKIEHHLRIVKNIGIDGRVKHGGMIPEDAVIEAVNVGSDTIVAVAMVESDGFFIIEGLAPGKYLLRIANVSNPPNAFELTVEKGLDWISDVIIEWP